MKYEDGSRSYSGKSSKVKKINSTRVRRCLATIATHVFSEIWSKWDQTLKEGSYGNGTSYEETEIYNNSWKLSVRFKIRMVFLDASMRK